MWTLQCDLNKDGMNRRQNQCTRVEKKAGETSQTKFSSGVFLGQSPQRVISNLGFNGRSEEMVLLKNTRLETRSEGRETINTTGE